MNCGNLLLHAGKDDHDGYIKSEIMGGVGGLALGSVIAGAQGDIFSIIAGLTTALGAKAASGEVNKSQCSLLLNGLSSFGKILAGVGAAHMLLHMLVPGVNFFYVLLAALGFVVAGDTALYLGKETAAKVMAVLSKKEATSKGGAQGNQRVKEGEAQPGEGEETEVGGEETENEITIGNNNDQVEGAGDYNDTTNTYNGPVTINNFTIGGDTLRI